MPHYLFKGFSNKKSDSAPEAEMCLTVPMVLSANEIVLEWATAKGFQLIDMTDFWALYLVPSRCDHFTEGKCNIEKNRPKMCRAYPEWLERDLPKLGLSMNPRNRKWERKNPLQTQDRI